MRVELLCLDVDGTMTDGSLIYGSNLGNSVLGMQFRTCENFRTSTDSSLVESPKISTNTKAIPQSLPLRFCESQNLGENQTQITESTLDSPNSAPSKQEANSAIADEFLGFCEASDKDKTKVYRGSEPKRALRKQLAHTCKSLKSRCESEFAEILKVFNAKDGLALAYWCKTLKRNAAIITGKKSEILRHRAKELGIEFLFMGVKDKGEIVRGLKKDLALDSAQVACVGDDLNDISMFAESSLNFAPRDCASHLKTLPNIEILRCKGGKGAVREAIEIILRKEGIYEDFTNFFAR